jgi:hypothetical protein
MNNSLSVSKRKLADRMQIPKNPLITIKSEEKLKKSSLKVRIDNNNTSQILDRFFGASSSKDKLGRSRRSLTSQKRKMSSKSSSISPGLRNNPKTSINNTNRSGYDLRKTEVINNKSSSFINIDNQTTDNKSENNSLANFFRKIKNTRREGIHEAHNP